MKAPTLRPVTRMFPIGTAGHNSRVLAMMMAGSSFLGATARATLWDGTTNTDWNDNTNWVGNAGTGGSNAEINQISPFAVISANIPATPVDILIGEGAGTSGRVDHRAGNAATGNGNWMGVGRFGGNGVYNLADTTGAGGTLTGFAPGSGNMTVGGRLYVGGFNGGGGTGLVNVNTTRTLAVGNDLALGSGGGTGVMKVDSGTITTGGWNFIGKNEGVAGGNGRLQMSGGTLTNNGARTFFGLGDTVGVLELSGNAVYTNTVGGNDTFLAVGVQNLANPALSEINLTGGTLNVGHVLSIGGMEPAGGNADGGFIGSGKGAMTINGAGALVNITGEFWVGQGEGSVGTATLSAGNITVNNWVAIGRAGGTGTLNMSGGTLTKTGGGNFIVGSNGNATGVMMQSGGLTDVQGGIAWVGENFSGTLTLSGTAEFRATELRIAVNESATGVVNFDGGTLRTARIIGGSGLANANVNFNGTQIIASATQANFISGLDTATLAAGGLRVDTNGFGITAPQILTGSGGVIKSGAGTLVLGGANVYTGAEVSNGGTLMVSTESLNNTSNVTVANGAGFGVQQNLPGATVIRNNITFGTTGASNLDFNLGNEAGNPTVAPLTVAGTLRLNGTVTVNITDQLPETGPIPLISYTGPKAGTGNFVLGTLPNGVVATLTDNGTGLVSLNVTSVALPYWNGTQDNVWNTTTVNWINQVGNTPIAYKDGNPVIFDDLASGPGGSDVALNTTVTPASVTFNNSALLYSLSGTGKISGSTGLLKEGTQALSIATVNDYTGVTTLSAGTTLIGSLGNGGVASSIGAATAAPSNLVLNGGILEYTGPTTTTNRGFTLAGANSVLSIQNDLTSSGSIVSNVGANLIKAGAGNLTLTNANYTIGVASPGLRVSGGTVTFNGGGSQTVNVGGDLWVGNVPDVPAALALQGTSLNVGGFIALGRGNGASGTLSTITATNSTITTANFSTGFDNGMGNDSDQNVVLLNSTWTTNGRTLLGESANATTNFVVSGTSRYQANDQLLMGMGQGSVVNLTIQDSGNVTKIGGWLAIGNGNDGVCNVLVKDSGSLVANADFNIGDTGASSGTLTIQDNATVSSANVTFVGKSAGDGSGSASGTIIQTGGTFTGEGTVVVGRFPNSTGTVTLSGGVFNQNGANNAFVLGELGLGTLTLSGTAVLNSNGVSLFISNGPTGTGVLNLNPGGTLVARRLVEGADGAGSGTINFNGGLLRVGANADPNFLNGLDAANVLAGGVRIDTNGSNIAIGQALLNAATTGGLTKTGLGALQLNGTNTYTGTTLVSAGILAGTGSIAGPLTTAAGTTLAPGAAAAGTFAVGGAATLSGAYAVELDGGASDTLAVSNTLNVSGATLAITTLAGGATQSAYVIASYTGATPAPFATVTGLPSGYTVNYAYNNGVTSTNIALVSAAVAPAYSAWISGFFPGETNPAIIGTNADPDSDGESNGLEFALGGAPNSGSNNAKVYVIAADSDGDADTTRELLLTIAVRTGSPAFTGSPAPASTSDGFTVRAEGGSDLSSFPTPVTPVGVVATGLPPAPSGYEYRTFSLSGSNGLPGRGFIRAKVTF